MPSPEGEKLSPDGWRPVSMLEYPLQRSPKLMIGARGPAINRRIRSP
jgi:hypothetical protein